ncbi:hypothetical protein ACMFMG_007764 [Clarireedia jacksonii]
MAYTKTSLLFLIGALNILMFSLEVQAITGTGLASIATANGTYTPTKPTSTGNHQSGSGGASGASSTAGRATGTSIVEGPGATTTPQLAMGFLAMFVGWVFAF